MNGERVRRGAVLACAALVVLAACTRRQPLGADGGEAVLARNLARARGVVLCVEENALEEACRRVAARARSASPFEVRVEVRGSGADDGAARVVVGSLDSPRATALLAHAGVECGARAFRFAGQTFEEPSDALVATFEDPDRRGLPVTIALAGDVAHAARLVAAIDVSARPWVRCYRKGDLVFSGPLERNGALRPADLSRVTLRRLALRGDERRIAGRFGLAFDVPMAISEADARGAIEPTERAVQRALGWCAPDVAPPRVEVEVVTEAEEMIVAEEGDRLGWTNPLDDAADMLLVDGTHDGGAAAARAISRAVLGPAVDPWIEEGASVDAAEAWWGRPLDRWLARLAAAGRVLSARRCVDPRAPLEWSTHVLGPSRAALFAFLRADRGDAFVRELWTGTRALDVDDELESAFAADVRRRVEPLLAQVAERARDRRTTLAAGAPLVGVGIAEARRDPSFGLGSRRARESVLHLAATGVGALCFTPQISDAEPARVPTLRIEPLAPVEGDLGLFVTARTARSLDLRLAFAPVPIASATGTSSGAWARGDEDDWNGFFARHAARMEHLAWCAELAGADLFAIGTAMPAVSSAKAEGRRVQLAEETWKRDGWRRVIGGVRGAFSGLVTYEAQDSTEARAIGFWRDLDAVGIELFPDVANADPGSGRNARQELQHALDLELEHVRATCREVGLPLAVMRVGCSPRLRGDRPAGADWTATQLDVVRDTLRGSGVPLAAAFYWRASTDRSDAGVNGFDCVLQGPVVDAALRTALADWKR